MTDLFDKAQELEQRQRDQALANQLHRTVEKPDEDKEGIRYCLDCGIDIPQQRLKAEPNAVRCVPCQSRKEH